MSQSHLASSRCAACKCLRRKCAPDCILAPHFPSSNPQRFASVHKVFGAANITKMLEQLPSHLRGQAADCIVFEAVSRMRDPVYGSVGIISQLQQKIVQVQNEIMKIHGEIALQSAHQHQHLHQHQHEAEAMLRAQQLGASSENGPGFGLQLDTTKGPYSLEVGSESGQLYHLGCDCDLDNNLCTN